jgi:hypothetical protein
MDVLRAVAFGVAAVALYSQLPLSAPPQTGLTSPLAFVVLTLTALTVGAAEVFGTMPHRQCFPRLYRLTN